MWCFAGTGLGANLCHVFIDPHPLQADHQRLDLLERQCRLYLEDDFQLYANPALFIFDLVKHFLFGELVGVILLEVVGNLLFVVRVFANADQNIALTLLLMTFLEAPSNNNKEEKQCSARGTA